MIAPWVQEEMQHTDLQDKRLNRRLEQILSNLGDRPTLSIPAACGGHKEMTAAYRFFNNQKASWDGILASHRESTIRRARNQKKIALVADTTEVDLTRPTQQVADVGPLDSTARFGLHLHAMEAFTLEGLALGEVWSQVWARGKESLKIPQEFKRKKRKTSPIEKKESFRWLEGLQQGRAFAQLCPDTQCVYVADSEADIFELFVEPRGEINPVHWVIRFCQDRATLPTSQESEEEEGVAPGRLIREQVLVTKVLFTKEISVRGRKAKVSCEDRRRRQPRHDRKAVVEVRATTLRLRPPWRSDRKLAEVSVNVVMVSEVNPPADDVAVEWVLLTTLPIETVEQVQEVIQFYVVRWMGEILFRTLKSGCRVEQRRLETKERMVAALAVYLIVAWRTLYVCHLGRNCPEMSCEAVFEPSEWKSVWITVEGKRPPKKPPGLANMVRLIAQLGGYVNRPNRKDPPGPQTVWIGLQRMHDLAWAWDVFGPGANKKDV